MIRMGIVGTGFVARGAFRCLSKMEGVEVSKVLTRRQIQKVGGIDRGRLTTSINDLVDSSDMIFECSGDAIHGTDVLLEGVKAQLPIITMNAELQVTTGSWFADKTYITEADGDQPGCLARLKLDAEFMGFRPLAYVNLKGYLNTDPCLPEMEHWAKVQKLQLDQVVSFTDGSKLQIEQALVANGLGATIARDGMLGHTVPTLRATGYLAELAQKGGTPLSDYVLCAGSPPGVMIVAEHEEFRMHGEYGPFAKLWTTDGRYGILLRPHHLIHLEVVRTVADAIDGRPPLLNNSTHPRVGVAALAKRPIKAGQTIARGLGGFQVRGWAVNFSDHPDHVPICLLVNAQVRRDIEPGQVVSFDDVELPPSAALEIYLQLRKRVSGRAGAERVPEVGLPAARSSVVTPNGNNHT